MARVTDTIYPWERRPKEPEKAYEAFLVYKNTGPGRTYTDTAKKLGKSRRLINRWGDQWNWKARVLEYDRDVERKAKEAAQQEQKKMIARHIKIASAVQEKAINGLKELKSEKMGAISVQALLDFGIKLERDSRAASLQETAGEQDAASILASVLEKAWSDKEGTAANE